MVMSRRVKHRPVGSVGYITRAYYGRHKRLIVCLWCMRAYVRACVRACARERACVCPFTIALYYIMVFCIVLYYIECNCISLLKLCARIYD